MLEAQRYPPLGFHFTVTFTGIPDSYNLVKSDAEFQSVSGLSVDIETEEIAEGGENRFKHKLPTRTKYPNLVLKRGLLADSGLIAWCRDAIENGIFNPVNVQIALQTYKEGESEENNNVPLMVWNLVNVYPLKWNVDTFNAEESKIVIETIEFSYNYFTSNPA